MADIGYVGVGNMGGALAARLLRQHRLLVHDRDGTAVQRLVAAGADAAEDLADVAKRCDVIFLCLPTSAQVRSVLFDDGGLAPGLRAGTLIIDQTTGDPLVTRELAEALAEQGVALVDAPVSGGISGAQAGNIAIMVGAGPRDYDRALPFLQSISPRVFRAGDIGNGHLIKLVNNLLSTVQRLLSIEGLVLAAKNGMAPEAAIEILLAGGGRNAYLEKQAPKIIGGDLDSGFTLGLAHKDVRLACELGQKSGVPMFLGKLAQELYQLYIAEAGASAQVDSVAVVLDRLAGTSVVGGES